jgi:hypothetical protein
MTALDTLRWGDTGDFVIPGTGPETTPRVSKQLVQASWRWPLTWAVQFNMVPNFSATETATFVATFLVTVGVGQATFTYPQVYTFAPAAGVYSPIRDQQLIPAENLQIILTSLTGVKTTTTQENFAFAVFAAPMTEPHAMTELLEEVRGGRARPRENGWMPEGFNPEPLEYRR